MAYTWDISLETGNSVIDSQHKQLIQAINELLAACSQGQGRAQIKTTGQFLLDYTKKHFSDEEQLQRQSRYPGYEAHKKYHEEFVVVVEGIMRELNAQGASVVLVGKINNALAGWLISHIKREDVKVAQHVKST